jgi:hypothetical protein
MLQQFYQCVLPNVILGSQNSTQLTLLQLQCLRINKASRIKTSYRRKEQVPFSGTKTTHSRLYVDILLTVQSCAGTNGKTLFTWLTFVPAGTRCTTRTVSGMIIPGYTAKVCVDCWRFGWWWRCWRIERRWGWLEVERRCSWLCDWLVCNYFWLWSRACKWRILFDIRDYTGTGGKTLFTWWTFVTTWTRCTTRTVLDMIIPGYSAKVCVDCWRFGWRCRFW